MHSATEDGAGNNPYERRRAEHHAHDGAENRAQAGDVQKLDEEHLPHRHLYIVDAVGARLRRHGALRVDAENPGGKGAVHRHQYQERNQQ